MKVFALVAAAVPGRFPPRFLAGSRRGSWPVPAGQGREGRLHLLFRVHSHGYAALRTKLRLAVFHSAARVHRSTGLLRLRVHA